IRAEEIPMQHIPTITGDIATVKIGKLHFHLWDFAGQEQFSYLWDNFIKGSDAALLITDSTLENVEKSKFFLELIKEQSPHAHTAVIGNKQDLKGAINPAQIERVLGLKSYSMVAKDPENRNKMIQIIADILEMSAEVSPLLKPLLERDKLIEEATGALKSADFEKAAFLFDKISYLCVELGDDSLGKEFYEKSEKIKVMLNQVGAPPPTPAFQIETDRKNQPIISKEPETLKKTIAPKPKISIETSEVDKPPAPKLPPQRPAVEQVISPKKIEVSNDKQEMVMDSSNNQKVGFQLNPEDFMVKLRPKRIGDVPKDAKTKLKTSAFGHVENIPKAEETIVKQKTTSSMSTPKEIITTSRPLELFEKKAQPIPTQPPQPIPTQPPQPIPTQPPQPTPTQPPQPIPTQPPQPTPTQPPQPIPTQPPQPVPTQPSQPVPTQPSQPVPTQPLQPMETADKLQKAQIPTMEQKQIEHIKKTLIELNLKKADLSKMALDFDMKELTGGISKEELEEKKKKIKEYEERIEKQIQDMQKLLKS
ncbi:MAG: ADP-ribosylation factor-like protein, partial [Candidatus Hermodarchaeota archaeon]